MNLDAEKGTLAAILTIEDFYGTLPINVSEDDFESSTHKLLARVALDIVKSGQIPTKTLIMSTAKSNNIESFSEVVKGGDEIDSLINLKPSKEEGLKFVKQLKKESIKRIAQQELRSLANYVKTTDEPLGAILGKLEDTVLKISSSTDFAENETIELAKNIRSIINSLGETPGNTGLDLGMQHWQERIGGIGNGMVHMIIATHKTGKSNIGMNAIINMSKYMPVLYIDTEMDDKLVSTRTMSILTKIPTRILKEGFWADHEHEHHMYYNKIQQGIEEYEKLNITYLRAAGRQVVDLIPAMRRWVIQNKAAGEGKFPQGLIVFDYVKLADFGDLQKFGLAEYQLLGLSMSALKDFCNKYRIPCITFGQTNREDDNDIRCLGASKRLADLADSVSLFKKKTPEMLLKDPNGSHILRVFLARHGPATEENEYIQVHYDKDVGTISELGMFKYSAPPQPAKKKFGKKSEEATVDEILDASLSANDD